MMLEPFYVYDHNNVYQWHRTILQTALALEREELVDWCFGYGPYGPDKLPEHRNIRRILDTHFKPDGAYWELCSGYHLYPMYHLCELAVLSRNISRMDPERFPPERYDCTRPDSPGGKVIGAALHWFMSMAMPDRTVTVIGDSTVPRAGMDAYAATAEIGYRYFGIDEVGDYERLRQGYRSWPALLYGAPEIVQKPTPFTSSYLSSGWISLRNEWEGNKVWVGLNALEKGGGHQHADRLTLTTYSHGQLLALEKATPYNESVTRVLGTCSQAHNTVTVDKTSSKQGEALTEEETPQVTFFYAGPVVQFAQLDAPNLYPQTTVYRRSVALVEDVVLDLFEVEGGDTHDWMVNHAGPAPTLSLEMAPGNFEPKDWLYNGTDQVRHTTTGEAWEAQWEVADITSRLTMLGAEATNIYALETYPIDNAVITPDNPPCQTLCVRRTDPAPFVAVWDAWREEPNVQAIQHGVCETAQGILVKTRENVYFTLFGASKAQFEGSVTMESDGAFALVSSRDTAVLVHGTRLSVQTPNGHLEVHATIPTTVAVTQGADGPAATCSADIHHDTHNGVDHPRAAPPAEIQLSGEIAGLF